MNDAMAAERHSSECIHTDAQHGLIHDRALACGEALALFDAPGEEQRGRGRGAVRRVESSNGPVILRHYRRGGWIGRFVRDAFFWSDADATRPFREFRITQRLAELELPVPKPWAARYQRVGAGYRADLATGEIGGACTLTERLAQPDSGIDWQELGAMIARFHAQGLWHADLNAHNILYDANDELRLIDFDRARLIQPFASVLQNNLDRLARSLRKLGHGDLVAGSAWRAVRSGYDEQILAAQRVR